MVSIIIPTYNRAYCLGRTIDSVIAQTHTDWEALIIDDGSTDETRRFIADTYGHDPRVRYIYQTNGGVSNARNTGIRECRGDYVAFLDSDDIWKPWKLAVQLEGLRRHPEAGMIWTDMKAVDPDGTVTNPRYLKTLYSAYRFFELETLFTSHEAFDHASLPDSERPATLFAGDIYVSMIMGSLVHTSTVLMRKDRLDQVGGFDESLKLSGEDYDFHLRTCKYGPVALLDVASIRYQTGRTDHLSNRSDATARNFLATLEKAIADDRGKGRLPAASIRRILAEAHGWLAEEEFKLDRSSEARSHAIQSLMRRPIQPRLVAMVGMTTLPQSLREALKNRYRRAKGIGGTD